MTRDANTLLHDVLRLTEQDRAELASRLLAQSSTEISADSGVMSEHPCSRGHGCSRKR